MKYKCLVCDGILEPIESTNNDLLYFEPCNFCVNEHIKNEIRKERIAQLVKTECPKCKGTGYSTTEQFIKGFMCGECGGAGWIRHA